MEITNTQPETIAGRLEHLAALYRRGQASEIISRTLSKLFDYEIKTCKSQLQQLKKDLSDFERQYNMSSEEFYQHFQEGQAKASDMKISGKKWKQRHNSDISEEDRTLCDDILSEL